MAHTRDYPASVAKRTHGDSTTRRHAGGAASSHEKHNAPQLDSLTYPSGTATVGPPAEPTTEATGQKSRHSNMHILKKARTELDEALALCEERLASMEGEFLSRWPGWHLCASLQVTTVPW